MPDISPRMSGLRIGVSTKRQTAKEGICLQESRLRTSPIEDDLDHDRPIDAVHPSLADRRPARTWRDWRYVSTDRAENAVRGQSQERHRWLSCGREIRD